MTRLKESDTDVYYVTTRKKDGECVFLNGKEMVDPIEGIRASAAIPFLNKDEVIINGEKYVDGDVAGSFPITKIISKINPTSLLIYANRPKNAREGMIYKLFKRFASVNQSNEFAEKFKNQEKDFEYELDVLKKSGIPYTIIWTDNLVGSLETEPRKLKVAARKFERYVTTLIRKNI